jgi:hypothetical protein
LRKSIVQRRAENPRVIHEFEGGPIALFWKNPSWFGPEYKTDAMKPIVFELCKDHHVFRDHKITPTIDAVVWKKMELAIECEECEECAPETCPRPIEEVGEKGSGMQLSETLEGWFIDLVKCTPWKVCDCCKGTGYVNNSSADILNEKVLKFIGERFPPGAVTSEPFPSVPGGQIVRDKSGDEMLLWWSSAYECFMWTNLQGKGKQALSSGGST